MSSNETRDEKKIEFTVLDTLCARWATLRCSTVTISAGTTGPETLSILHLYASYTDCSGSALSCPDVYHKIEVF